MPSNICKSLDGLDARFRPLIDRVIAELASNRSHLIVFETTRTLARQKELMQSGASKLSNGPHNHGMAVDFCLDTNRFGYSNPWQSSNENKFKGLPMTAQADAQWKLLGSIAMAHGLEWGGSWGWDMPHVQLKNWKVLSRGQ